MKPTMKLPQLMAGLVFATLGLAGGAQAHDDAALATQKAPHGGQLKVAGPWHLELVQQAGPAGGNTLLVYVTDHDGKPIAAADFAGTATILAGKEKTSAPLQRDGANRLKATARYDAKANPKIIVAVSGGGQSEQARFTPAP